VKKDGDPRPLGVLRVEALEALVLLPWETSREPVTADLTVIAPVWSMFPDAGLPPGCLTADSEVTYGGPAGPVRIAGPGAGLSPAPVRGAPVVPGSGLVPGAPMPEVDGQPITAAYLRELLERLDAICPGGLQAPAGGTLELAVVDPATGRLRATLDRGELQRLARRGCRTHPAGDCACPLLDRPPSVDRYQPTPAQRRFLKTRDRTCRHPGCANRAGWADIDHVIPHAEGGKTDCENLCCLYRRHHRLKTHAHGWRFEMNPDGTLSVTSPSGVTRTTRPPGLHDPEPPPPPSDDPPPF
jgi:hypothetical protein